MAIDSNDEYLKLLSIFHFLVAAAAGALALLPCFHLLFGLFMVVVPATTETPEAWPMMVMGGIFTLFALGLIVSGLLMSMAIALCGWFIVQRKHHRMCMVLAGLECLLFPFGTVLGVFTLIILGRESVREAFQA